MRKTLAAVLVVTAGTLVMAASAFAHFAQSMTASCTGASLTLASFSKSDGPVNWNVAVDGQQTNTGTEPAFHGSKTITATYPTALTGPAPHNVVFSATWTTSHGSLSKTVTGCPAPPLPCPNQPPTAPCNCPPGATGPQGPPGVTTTITVVENHQTVVYVDKTCTSARVFHITIPKRLSRAGDFNRKDKGQRIVGARIVWRGADAAHKTATKKATAALKNGRLKVDADFRGVKAVSGQERVIDEYLKLANGRTLHLIRKVRLCMPRDGDLNGPTDLPQNGRSDGASADAAKAAAAKAPKYRKAVI